MLSMYSFFKVNHKILICSKSFVSLEKIIDHELLVWCVDFHICVRRFVVFLSVFPVPTTATWRIS